MKLEIFDSNVSQSMNIFIVIANVLNLFYNLPQMWLTYKRKTTKDISSTFMLLRFVTNIIWIVYAIEIDSFLFLVNNCVTVFSSMFVGYYKVNEVWQDYKLRRVLVEINEDDQTL